MIVRVSVVVVLVMRLALVVDVEIIGIVPGVLLLTLWLNLLRSMLLRLARCTVGGSSGKEECLRHAQVMIQVTTKATRVVTRSRQRKLQQQIRSLQVSALQLQYETYAVEGLPFSSS